MLTITSNQVVGWKLSFQEAGLLTIDSISGWKWENWNTTNAKWWVAFAYPFHKTFCIVKTRVYGSRHAVTTPSRAIFQLVKVASVQPETRLNMFRTCVYGVLVMLTHCSLQLINTFQFETKTRVLYTMSCTVRYIHVFLKHVMVYKNCLSICFHQESLPRWILCDGFVKIMSGLYVNVRNPLSTSTSHFKVKPFTVLFKILTLFL